MRKCISAIAAASVLACVATAVPASAQAVTSCEFALTADKTSVHAGDVVNFTLAIKPNGDLYGLEATLSLPEGIEFVWDSGKLIDGVDDTLDWDDIAFTESKAGNTVKLTGFTAMNPYTKATELKVATFSCKATKSGVVGNVTLSDMIALNDEFEQVSASAKEAEISVYDLKKVAAKPSTCKEKGNNEYYACECGQADCDRVYKADKTTKTTVEAETLELSAHDFTAETVDEKFLSTAATCSAPAKYFKSCTVCGEKGTETFESGEKDPAKHGSNTEIKDKVDATCTTPGYTGDTYCKDCGAKIKNGEAITAAHKGGKATCSAKAKCEVCGEEYGELDPNNHVNTEVVNAKEATEDAEGYTGDKVCKDCNTELEKGTTIPKIETSAPDNTSNEDSGNDSGNDSGTASGSGNDSGSAPSSESTSDSKPGNTSSKPDDPSSSKPDVSSQSTPSNPANTKPEVPTKPSNPSTGVTLTVVPVILAAGAFVVISKNKKR